MALAWAIFEVICFGYFMLFPPREALHSEATLFSKTVCTHSPESVFSFWFGFALH